MKIIQKIIKNKGITLITLVITIIVLLILAGIAISLISENNDILNISRISKVKYQNSVNEESDSISSYENAIDKVKKDIASSRDDNISSEISDFRIEVVGQNATYITVKVSEINSTIDIFGYVALLNGKPVDLTKEQEYSFCNLDYNTEYNNMQLVAVDENLRIKYSNIVTGKTTDRLYLYNRGNECTAITGGWTISNEQWNGRSQKNSDNILLYYSSTSYSQSTCKTNKKVDLTGFKKLYVIYKKTKSANNSTYSKIQTSLGTSSHYQNGDYQETFNCSQFNNVFSIIDFDAYDYIYEVYAE